jgi:hypothetical protein
MARGLLPVLCAQAFVAFANPQDAEACSTAAAPTHLIDPTLAATDANAPTPPAEVVAVVGRRLGTHCDDDGCVSSSCGDSATLTLNFRPATDDQSAAAAIGYLVVGEVGTLPVSITTSSPRPAPNGQLTIGLGFDEAATLATTAQLVAYDAAGNSSVPSEPFDVRFSGCTRPPFGDACVEDESGCSVASLPPVYPGSRVMVPSLLLLGVAVVFARARMKRTRHGQTTRE